MLKSLLCILLFVNYSVSSKCQQAALTVSFSKDFFNSGDTVEIEFNLLSTNRIHNKATINCVIKNDAGFEQRLRWPLLNKSGVVQLVLDKKLKHGLYDFYFYVQGGIFQLNGKVLSPGKQSTLKTVLINNRGEVTLSEITVDESNNFKFGNYIFEHFANVIFSDKKGKQNKLDIRIEALLDSAYQPIAISTRRIKIGGDAFADFSDSILPVAIDSLPFQSSNYLQEIVVYGTKKNVIDRYEQNYVGGLFKDADSRMFDLINDPLALGSTDIFEYLQAKVPNMRIRYNKNGDADVFMRNAVVQFYLDEIPLEVNYVRSISISDIAFLKIMPPPFIGNPGGNGAAVAIYTRRGADANSKNTGNYRFRVKGYTPAISVLSSGE
ncbi:hypothetical protein [Lacibacter sp.]|uniref:hypothetical protein n=1 Tax=Lacibacter sp. TaxID=1915409 RepID=UPI002B4B3215|nr:hypothetical protein [Lacibacter sp.]